MKGKILSSYWEPEVGIASVTKATRYGEFSGEAMCKEEDLDIMNEWDGYAIAEFSCDVQATKARLKQMRLKLLGMQELIEHSGAIYLPSVVQYSEMKKGQYEREKKKFQQMVDNRDAIIEQWLLDKRKFREQHS